MTLDRLRGPADTQAGVSPAGAKRARKARLSAPEATRVSADEIAKIAYDAILPDAVTDLRMTTVVERGGELPNGTPSGVGGRTLYGPVWVIRGREDSEPIYLFESMLDARELFALLAGEEGDLWQRKQRRLNAIAAAEAAELEAAAIAKANAKTVARAQASEDGNGSPRRSRSSERPTASSGRGMSRRERLRRASKTTS